MNINIRLSSSSRERAKTNRNKLDFRSYTTTANNYNVIGHTPINYDSILVMLYCLKLARESM